MTTPDPREEAYRLARVAMKSTGYVEDFGEDGVRDLARIVVDAVSSHLRHRGCMARIQALEAELAQSQAEVERLTSVAKFREAAVEAAVIAQLEERALADELAKALRIHMNVYGVDWQGCNEFKRTDEELLARWKAIRSGAQGEEGDGAV